MTRQGDHGEVKGPAQNSTLTVITVQNIVTTECVGPFGEATTIEFNGCDYQLTIGTTINEMETTGSTHLICPSGKQITITGRGGFCQTHIPAQQPGGHVIYKTITGTPNHVTAKLTITGTVYQGTGLCTSGADGQLRGNLTIKGFKKTPHEAAQQTSIEVH